MANLRDMEELVLTIENENIRDYMREALSCYMTKAYRGCIVLSFIALFDDITSKLEKLGGVNKVAKTIYENAKAKKDAQDVYENFLIEQLKSKNLLSEMDSEFADILRRLRNKSAHPSGHRPSAEEARYVFFEVINRFLSKPIFSTNHLVGEIIDRLTNDNFFVETGINKIAEVVEEEISSLHLEAIPSLISKLLDNYISDNKVIKKNSSFFINGLARLNDEKISIFLIDKLLKRKSDNQEYNDIILGVISSIPDSFKTLNNIHKTRIKKIISSKIKKSNLSLGQDKLSHPCVVLKSLANVYSDNEYNEEFYTELLNLFNKAPNLKHLSVIFKGKDLTFNSYINLIIEKIGDPDYNISNEFCGKIIEIQDIYKDYINEKQAFYLIANIIKSKKRGAFKAENLVNEKFSSIKFTKNKTIEFIDTNRDNAENYFKTEIDSTIPDFLIKK
ncbi:hypothetical protein [Acinetobacter baumannii]|uniref:hypothetical protein n=1 Tax=Acinetobacter baumannii TaxID=470 RepID=UPI0030078B9B